MANKKTKEDLEQDVVDLVYTGVALAKIAFWIFIAGIIFFVVVMTSVSKS